MRDGAVLLQLIFRLEHRHPTETTYLCTVFTHRLKEKKKIIRLQHILQILSPQNANGNGLCKGYT